MNTRVKKVRRISSLLLILLLLITTAMALLWFNRNALTLKYAQSYVEPYQVALVCIDWSLTRHLALKIKTLCLNHPLATVELNNLTIDQPLKPQLISIEQATVKGKQALLPWLQNQQSGQQQAFTPQQATRLLDQLSQFTLPFALELKHFDYQAFQTPVTSLSGSLKSTDRYRFELFDASQQPIIAMTLSQTAQGFDAQLSTDFNRLLSVAQQHQWPTAKLVQGSGVSGQLNSQVSYLQQQQQLTLNTQVTDFNFAAAPWLKHTAPLKLSSKRLNWEMQLTKQQLQLHGSDRSQTISVEPPGLQQLLSAQPLPPAILAVLQANPLHGLTLTIPAQFQLNFNHQQLTLSPIKLNDHHPTHPLRISADNTQLNLNDKSAKFDFAIDSTLSLPQLNPYTTQPLKLTATGSLQYRDEQLEINFNQGTSATLQQLKWAGKTPLTLKQAKLQWQGSVQYRDHQINSNLQLNTRLSQVFAANIAQAAQLAITTTLKGSPEQFSLHSSFVADNLALGQLTLSGHHLNPTIKLSGSNIALTELLAFNLNRRYAIELVDGQFDYDIAGQLLDFAQPLNNDLTIDWHIRELSGEVEKHWLQQFNFEQHWQLNQGKLYSQPSSAPTNLSLAMVEAGTPVTDIKAKVGVEVDLLAGDVQSTFKTAMNNISGQLLGGSFAIATFNWPNPNNTAMQLQLDDIDLAQVVALQQQPGIVVTGLVSGAMPITLSQQGTKISVTIDNGQLYNVSNGVIKIKDNPTVQRLKQSRDELKLAFDALQNLNYYLLQSTVTMTDDGQMRLETQIKGVNPDLDNEVNFNLNLDYDLLGLLKSAQMGQTLEQQLNSINNHRRNK